MKTASLILSISLLGNLALGAFLLRGPSPGRPGADSASGPTTPTAVATSSGHSGNDALRSALASGDAAALQAAGASPEVARQLAAGRAFERMAVRLRAAQGKGGDTRWWRSGNRPPGERSELDQARRELSDTLTAAFGTDLFASERDQAQLAFLAPEKREALRRISQDYAEMETKFGASGLQLPSDREKLRLLRAERDRDIAALLSPAEFADYELRTSPSAATLRARFGEGIETEDDFRKLFALQKDFDERYPREALQGRISPDVVRARADAERQLQAEMRAAVGDDRYAAMRRAADTDLRTVESLVNRLGLPAQTTDRIAAARDGFATESQRINGDSALSPQQRRAQITDLGARAKADLVRTLGSEAADAYGQRSPWMNYLQNGTAFSTSPTPNSPAALSLGGTVPSVYPVLPAGTPAGAVRQVMNVTNTVGGPAGGGGPGGSTFMIGAPGGGPTENVQVMSFTAVEHVGGPAAPPAAAAPVAAGAATPGTHAAEPAPAPKP